MTDTFRAINDRGVFWKDTQDFVHVCEGAIVHQGVRLLWTLCERDVPANNAFHQESGDKATCATCLARLTHNVKVSGRPHLDTIKEN